MNSSPDTDLDLIARVKDSADSAAWAEFLAIYRPVVYRLARKRGLQHSDAEDLAQQVFLSIARAIEGWEATPDRPGFRAWLYKIAHNAILNSLSRRRPDTGSGSTTVWSALEEFPADDAFNTQLTLEARRQVFRWAATEILPEFSEPTWRIFWETAVTGRSVQEIAAKENVSVGAVYMARFRVMQRLKEKVTEATEGWT